MIIKEATAMRQSATVAMQAEKLPKELSSALEGCEAGAFYSVHAKKMSVEDTAYFLEIRAKVQEGLADIEAGNVLDEEEAFAEIERLMSIKANG
jgi:predicted transcriptional regulator